MDHHEIAVGSYRIGNIFEVRGKALDGSSAPLPIDADDPVLMRLRSTQSPVMTHDFVSSRLHRRAAFPLVVFGTITGAMHVQYRESGERFDPDEVAVLQRVAHELAIALLWVERTLQPAP